MLKKTGSLDHGFFGERRKGTRFHWITKRAAKFTDQLGHNRVTLRCDNELAIEALPRAIVQARQEGSQTVPERPPVGLGLRWSKALAPGSRRMRGYCVGWWSSPRT